MNDLFNIKLKNTDWIAGAESGIIYKVNETTGDWSFYLPEEEYQRVFFDTLSCVTFSGLNVIETLMQRMILKDEISKENISWLRKNGYIKNGMINFSDRYSAKMSNTTKSGNFLTMVADSFRTYGLVPENLYPNDAKDWESYYSEIPQEIKDLGLEFAKRFNIKYEWVLCGKQNVESIKYHLKQSPIQIVSTCCKGWSTDDIVQSCGIVSEHATIIYGYTNTYLKDFDSYSPFKKKLAIDYGIVWALKYVIEEKVTEEKQSFEYTFKNIMFKGRRSEDIKMLQTLLKLEGLYSKDIDCTGYYGNITQNAVKLFCKKYNVASKLELSIVNGRWCGSKTIKKLNEISNNYK